MNAGDSKKAGIGIVHFGPGAFHRAHQADYVDRILKSDPRWGIAAVSLRSAGTVEALKRQEGRYTLAILDSEISFRPIEAHKAFIGPGDDQMLRTLLANPGVRIVTSTVTEKGYCLASDGSLDFGHADIVHDLAEPGSPLSLIGWIALGLIARRASGIAPFTTICCDNMTSNGSKLRAAVIAFAERIDPDAAKWIEAEARFPDTMVDSITPATDDSLRELVREQTGFDDRIPVRREAYSAWIIEDCLPPGMPDLAAAGVILTPDVGAWERAKLRILNGSHSTLAYLGLALGHETVADAMGERLLADFVRKMVDEEVIPTLRPSPMDLDAYAADIFGRFANPAIHHRLSQIAWDGSQKLPYRILDTVADGLREGTSIRGLATAVAAWMAFIVHAAQDGSPVTDPLARQLLAAGREPDAADRLLSMDQIFPPAMASSPIFRAEIMNAFDLLQAGRARQSLTRCLE